MNERDERDLLRAEPWRAARVSAEEGHWHDGHALVTRAYEFEELAARFSDAGLHESAESLRTIAHSLREMGRQLIGDRWKLK